MQRRILTIEDPPYIRRLIRMPLAFKGHRVIQAGDGGEGLQPARRVRPDLVPLGAHRPGISGLEVGAEMSRDPDPGHLPVGMVSALGMPEAVQAGLARGVHAYLAKAFSPCVLLHLIEQQTQSPDASAVHA